ncbi:MAG TPA: histidinol-phosphatase, partial [Bacteroidales bacterium]|nr:histidinol-phosphatase [Bacteroidales bacterium]
IDRHLPMINNRSELFGYQVLVDEHENIIRTEDRLLISALQTGLAEVEEKVHQLEGICIPAHINKVKNSILSQLGFIPAGSGYDALEISGPAGASEINLRDTQDITLVRNSDAHYLKDIGTNRMFFHLEERSFREIKMALAGQNGRRVELL